MNSLTFAGRRKFLKLLGMAGAAAALAGCQLKGFVKPRTSTPDGSVPLDTSPNPMTDTPAVIQSATSTSIPPTLTATSTLTPALPTATATPVYKAMVATGRASAYDPTVLRKELERMLQGLGGLTDLVKAGARVGIKVNLTGGTWWDGEGKPKATEYFVTHPTLVGVLGELLIDAGAGKLVVMDGLGDETSFEKWGYNAMAKPLGIQLIDLCKPAPYAAFAHFPVGAHARMYEYFNLNGILNDIDVFLSVAKMKCHLTAGVTLSMKNLIGLAPTSLYRLKETENNRSAFHGDSRFDTRLPRVILDLNQARPIHLAVIDGVLTAEGGAGPWDSGLTQVKPGVLVAGKNALGVDAVTAAVMGFDPQATSGTTPFTGGDNHLALAYEAGLGTNRLEEIGITGPAIQELIYKFKPA